MSSFEFCWLDSSETYGPRRNFREYGKFICVETAPGVRKIYAGNFEYHSDIFDPPNQKLRGPTIIAAGLFDQHAIIGEWFSRGMGLNTPQNLREPIQSLFDKHAELVRQNWK